MSKKKDTMGLPEVSFSWNIRFGDVLTALALVATVVGFFLTIQSSMSQAKADIELMKAENRGRDQAFKNLATKTQDQFQILGEKTAGLQTAITFIAPQLQRIEDKLNTIR